MLNQAILLNINIGKKEMSTAIGLYIVIALYFVFFSRTLFFPVALLILIGFVAATVLEIKAINKVCYASLFDAEGTLYMTIPISAKNMVLGKVLTISTFLLIESWILYFGLILATLLSGSDVFVTLNDFSFFLPTLGESSLETVITFALFPLSSFLENFFQSAILLTTFVTLGLRKKKLFFCWVVAIVIFTPFGLATQFITDQLEDMAYGSAIAAILCNLIYIAASYFALKKCVRELEERYDV